jgi:hypothetical protein
MALLAVQLNHPGSQKPFKIGKGYVKNGDAIVREWNSDRSHYRKFLEVEGQFIGLAGDKPISEKLHLWGEWEGHSFFSPLQGYDPNGIHRPVHDVGRVGSQNTDPYIYGPNFYYAVCKQRGQLTRLEPGSLILFGSSFKGGFALDTVFVVDSWETVHEVAKSGDSAYSSIYREATLERLGDIYSAPAPRSALRLYGSRTYQQDPNLFSYVPCKPLRGYHGQGFPRVGFGYGDQGGWDFSSNPTGWKVLGEGADAIAQIYAKVLEHTRRAECALAVGIQEPQAMALWGS